jgi:hypothetical protein
LTLGASQIFAACNAPLSPSTALDVRLSSFRCDATAFGSIWNRGNAFMATQSKDTQIFTWTVGTLMVVLLAYGLLTIIGVLR